MPHKVYQMTSKGMRTGMAPNGVELDIGATDHNGRDLPAIEEINWNSRTYRRAGGQVQDFPREFYNISQIVWDE